MTEEEYLKERVAHQITWYDEKSAWNKKWFLRVKAIETLLALLIPFLTGYITTENIQLKIIVGIIGIVVAASAGLATLFKLQENWIEYRTVAESLKHEKFLYMTKSGPYKENSSFSDFAERFESYVSKENSQWTSYINPKKEGK